MSHYPMRAVVFEGDAQNGIPRRTINLPPAIATVAELFREARTLEARRDRARAFVDRQRERVREAIMSGICRPDYELTTAELDAALVEAVGRRRMQAPARIDGDRLEVLARLRELAEPFFRAAAVHEKLLSRRLGAASGTDVAAISNELYIVRVLVQRMRHLRPRAAAVRYARERVSA